MVKARITIGKFAPYRRNGRRFWSIHSTMAASKDEARKLSWSWWAPWALLAVVGTSLLTVVATLYDIV
jgi:hypothetical protein